MNTRSNYIKPTLKAHGSVASLTLSTPGSDIGMMTMAMTMTMTMSMTMGMGS